MTNSRKSVLQILVECALFIAVSAVLSILKLSIFPYGGSVTLCSMLPIILISYRRGIRWGLLSGLVFSLLQLVTGGFKSAGLNLFSIAIALIFDYLLAFTLLGLGGLFRKRCDRVRTGLIWGTLLSLSLRFICHIVSGILIWGSYAEWFFSQTTWGNEILLSLDGNALSIVYSVLYNATYMIPEMIITSVAAALMAPFALYGLAGQEDVGLPDKIIRHP